MPEKTVFSIGSPWGLVNFLLDRADDALETPELVAEALSLEDSGRQTVSGLMDMRMLVRDGNGNEVAFPINFVIDTTFSLNQATPLDIGADIKRKKRLRWLIPDAVRDRWRRESDQGQVDANS